MGTSQSSCFRQAWENRKRTQYPTGWGDLCAVEVQGHGSPFTQVVVKLVRAPKGMKGISNNLTYISRDGQLEIED